MKSPPLHIAVGIVHNEEGAILIARRPDHAHQGGLWEFPGGKVEAGESVIEALRRELAEEVGIDVMLASPFMQTEHVYDDRSVLLDVWRVERWQGEARGCEGQAIAWVSKRSLASYAFPEADVPIVNALRFPAAYLITPETDYQDDAFFERLHECLEGGIRLVQFRAKTMSDSRYEQVAREVLRLCHSHDAAVILNGPATMVLRLGAQGVHLPSAKLLQLQQRPLPMDFLVTASCHNATEVRHATAIAADFCLISPVFETTSHPDAQPIGWEGFRYLARSTRIPAFALGGLHPLDLPTAWQHGAHGIAMITGVWDANDVRTAAAACVQLGESRFASNSMHAPLSSK